jgi:hypothetical protein
MSEESKVTFTPEQQALVDKKIGLARIKARETARIDFETKAAKDKEAADQAALVAQQEWQTLAETRGARVTELEPLEKRIEDYEKMVKGLLKDAIEGLGDTAKSAVDALPESMTAIEKLNWLGKNQELFQASGGPVGTPKRPKTSKKPNTKPEEICKYPLRL